jgi:hypothetical protein
MDDHDEIYNCYGLKYNPSKFFSSFDSLFFMGIKIKGKKGL